MRNDAIRVIIGYLSKSLIPKKGVTMGKALKAIGTLILVAALCASYGNMSILDPCRLLGLSLSWVTIISENQFTVPDANLPQFGMNKFFFEKVLTDLGPHENGRRYQVDSSCGSLSTLAERAQNATPGATPAPITIGLGLFGVLIFLLGFLPDLKIFNSEKEPAGA